MNNDFAVFAVLYRRDERGTLQILLIQDHTMPGKWKLAGGKSEAGETPHRTLVRELHEELSINVSVHSIGSVLYVAPIRTHAFVAYPVPYSRKFGPIRINTAELLCMQWFELKTMERMLHTGHILPHHTAALLDFIAWQET